MAECLIFNQDNTHEDILISERDCYKQGDVIVMMPDNHPWGKQEHPDTATNPKFWLVKLLNVDAQTLLHLTYQYTQLKQDTDELETLLQRLWKLDISQLSTAQLTELITTGQLTLDWTISEPMFVNKITGTN